jgi:hypothetical protein
MPKRSSNIKKDLNKLASSIVDQAIGEAPAPISAPVDDGKNPAAVALGRLGGKKGGHARAKKLSANKRRLIAKKAATARWKKVQAQ